MHRRFLKLRDAFPKSGDEYAQQAVRLLQRRREEMDAAWEELEEGWKASNERMVKVGVRSRTDKEGMVKLNVGGSNITLFWHLLTETKGFEDSVLGALLEGVWDKERIPRDADGCIVLDESPACIRHIMNTVLNGGASSVAEGLPAIAADEIPCLIYTAHVMGLPLSVPTHYAYVKMHGGSTVMEPFEIAPFSEKIRKWVGGSTDEMTLIYRATRDGFGSEPFFSRCDKDSPNTVFLLRVRSDQGNDDDSVVGGYSVFPWVEFIDQAFLFTLKDGSATRKKICKPTKWETNPCVADYTFTVNLSDGPHLGRDLVTIFNETSGSCIIKTKPIVHDNPTGESSPFLELDGRVVVEIEVYHCSTPAPPTTTVSSTTEPGGDALTGVEAHDIRSFGVSIANSLMEERMVLDRAVKEMEAAGARVSAAVRARETVYGPSVAAGEQDAVVELNVRETRMTTLRSTLQACPRSALAAMFNEERWPATDKDKDEHGRRLIDCNPVCFSKILDVLRMRKRASWSPRATPEKQKESSGRCPGAVLIKKADLKAFRTAVHMYFPGCESFIM
ncbi:unnamed protein product, partial [Laminaria digitata]